MLLYRSGYMVGQYISIEKAIADTKNDYYDALAQADVRWHEEENDPKPFIKYMLGIILSCYREFESRVNLTGKAGVKSTAYDIVKKYALDQVGTFTKRDALDIEEAYRDIQGKSLPRILRQNKYVTKRKNS